MPLIGREIDVYLMSKVFAQLLQIFAGVFGLHRPFGFVHGVTGL